MSSSQKRCQDLTEAGKAAPRRPTNSCWLYFSKGQQSLGRENLPLCSATWQLLQGTSLLKGWPVVQCVSLVQIQNP